MKVILSSLLAISLGLNLWWLSFSEPETVDDSLNSLLNQIGRMKPVADESVNGFYLGPYPLPKSADPGELSKYFVLWIFREDGIARKVTFQQEQKWELEEGQIYLDWPFEGFR